MVVLAFLKLLGCLGLLMYGMKMLGESMQKMAGNQLRHTLDSLTTNRFMSIITGALITAALQSSTATSIMTVNFVHAGMLSLVQALPVMMGASVGNTIVAWIMALEFNFEISSYIYPLILVALAFSYSRNGRLTGELIFSICLIFLGLGLFYHFAGYMQLTQHNQLTEYLSVNQENYLTYLLLMVIGAVVTFTVHSSAVLMATGMILCATGVWSLYSGAAFILGENIGRALITYRSAASANVQARRTAFGQMVFNLGGTVWMFLLFPFFIDFLCDIIGTENNNVQGNFSTDKHMAYILAAFHTGFNLFNVIIGICVVTPLERLSRKIIERSKNTPEEKSGLRYIIKGQADDAEASICEAQKEILNYSDIVLKMFNNTRYLFSARNEAEFKNIFVKIEHYEITCDEMEIDIANFLNKLPDEDTDLVQKSRIRSMLKEISEIESIADSCHHIARTANRNFKSGEQFGEKQLEHLHQMFQLSEQALMQMKTTLSTRKAPRNIQTSYYIENEINNFRKQLRSLNIIDINDHKYSYLTGTMYMDIINECEQMADCVINVIEAHTECNTCNRETSL